MNPENWMRAALKELKPYSSARDEYQGGEKDMVFLDANENPFGNGLNRYPDPHHRSLRRELSRIKQVPMESLPTLFFHTPSACFALAIVSIDVRGSLFLSIPSNDIFEDCV